jgi:hypothetical protein
MKYCLYIDESGDHVLNKNLDYPIFLLGGVLISQEEEEHVLTPLLNDLKNKYFGRTSAIMHTAEFLRPRDKNSVYYIFCAEKNLIFQAREPRSAVLPCLVKIIT